MFLNLLFEVCKPSDDPTNFNRSSDAFSTQLSNLSEIFLCFVRVFLSFIISDEDLFTSQAICQVFF